MLLVVYQPPPVTILVYITVERVGVHMYMCDISKLSHYTTVYHSHFILFTLNNVNSQSAVDEAWLISGSVTSGLKTPPHAESSIFNSCSH